MPFGRKKWVLCSKVSYPGTLQWTTSCSQPSCPSGPMSSSSTQSCPSLSMSGERERDVGDEGCNEERQLWIIWKWKYGNDLKHTQKNIFLHLFKLFYSLFILYEVCQHLCDFVIFYWWTDLKSFKLVIKHFYYNYLLLYQGYYR